MAQRMESVAPPGGVMLSESTARLVETCAVLGEPEMVHIKGADEPVPAHRLLADRPSARIGRRGDTTLVGREWELAALTACWIGRSSGHGGVVGVVGPPGIGKSRLVPETAATGGGPRGRGLLDVLRIPCQRHPVPCGRPAAAGGLRGRRARRRVGAGTAAGPVAGRRRRRSAAARRSARHPRPRRAAARYRPRRAAAAAHRLGQRRLAGPHHAGRLRHRGRALDRRGQRVDARRFPRRSSRRRTRLVLITYRPEYRGALSRVPGAQTICLAPLNDSQTTALIAELLGRIRRSRELGRPIADRAAGNPFFAEEIVRDLAERGVLEASAASTCARSRHRRRHRAGDPAGHDRRPHRPPRRRGEATLNAAAVIGSRFDADLLAALVDRSALDELVAGGTDRPGQVHPARRVRVPPSADPHGGLRVPAESRSRRAAPAAGGRDRVDATGVGRRERRADRRAPGGRRRSACRVRLAHARGSVVDATRYRGGTGRVGTGRLKSPTCCPTDDPDRLAMRIAPRTLSCANGWRIH